MNASFTPPATFADLIARWGSITDFSRETNQPYERVKRWKTLNDGKGSIHPKYWPSVKGAAWARGWYWVDDALLARLAATTAAENAV